MVPFLDLPAAYDELRDELDAAWHRVASSGRCVLGPELEAFEHEFAAFCGAAHATGVGSRLDALHLHGDAARPNAERLAVEVLSLPVRPHITAAQQDDVVAATHAVLAPSAASASRI